MPHPGSDAPLELAGAGPCGLTAAILLRKAGRSVRVHEAKPGVGSRWKRGFQIIENFSERQDVRDFLSGHGVRMNFTARPIHSATLWNGRKTRAEFRSEAPLGFYVLRGGQPGDLDRGLLEQAQEAGVEVLFGSAKTAREVRINATGPRRVDGMGKEVTFRTRLGDRLEVILDPTLVPGGYGYLFVAGGEATLGMAIIGHYKEMDVYFDRTVRRFCESGELDYQGGEEAYLVANFFLNKSLEDSGRLSAGEAGGFQDYLFGFGIRYALHSGVLAARSILENVSYDSLWKGALERKQKASLFNRFLYEKCQLWLPWIFIKMARRSKDFRSYMRSWYDPHPLKMMTADWIAKSWKKKRVLEGSTP